MASTKEFDAVKIRIWIMCFQTYQKLGEETTPCGVTSPMFVWLGAVECQQSTSSHRFFGIFLRASLRCVACANSYVQLCAITIVQFESIETTK